MANAFKISRILCRHRKRRCLYRSPTETTIIGLNVANILAVSITVSVQLINNDGDNVHIVKDAIVLVGSSLVAVGGDQKIVMNASDMAGDASQASAADEASWKWRLANGSFDQTRTRLPTARSRTTWLPAPRPIRSGLTLPASTRTRRLHRQRTLGASARLPCPR